jgi:hypothetical protein
LQADERPRTSSSGQDFNINDFSQSTLGQFKDALQNLQERVMQVEAESQVGNLT